jgi:hypothetical protein
MGVEIDLSRMIEGKGWRWWKLGIEDTSRKKFKKTKFLFLVIILSKHYLKQMQIYIWVVCDSSLLGLPI